MEWAEAEVTLATEAGREMARDPFKEDLPLHMACERKAPESTILALLEANRDAAAVPGRYGGFPLHLAAQQKLSPKVLVSLIRAFPEALDQEDDAKHLPRDYSQKNDLSREALHRPTACWIEDVEKEEYMERVDRKKLLLQEKIQKLRVALQKVNRRRDRLHVFMEALEPRLQSQRHVLERLAQLEVQLDQVHETHQTHIHAVTERIKKFSASDEFSYETDEEEIRMRSLMRRTYMQGVQRQYEKLVGRTDAIRHDLQHLRTELAKRRVQSSGTSTSTSSEGDNSTPDVLTETSHEETPSQL